MKRSFIKLRKVLGLFVIPAMLTLGAQVAQAQVKIGNNPGTINGSSVLEIESTNKGLLLPRVPLVSTTAWGLATATPAQGMQVYNTTVGITPGSAAYPIITGGIGVYYWDGTGWVATKGGAASGLTVDLRLVGTANHITQDAGVGNNGTGVGTGQYNIGIGQETLGANTTGGTNVAIGLQTLKSNTTGGGNIALGYVAMTNNTTGANNVALGVTALTANISGAGNTALGYGAASNVTSGGNNIAIGQNASIPVPNGSNQMNIGSAIYGTGMTGATGAGLIGVGTAGPTSKLHVSSDANTYSGQFRVGGVSNLNKSIEVGFNTTTNQGYIQPSIAGSNWSDLVINPNGGNVGIGTSAPGVKLQVTQDLPDYSAGQIAIIGAADAQKALRIGYNTTTDKSFVQSVHGGVAYTDLLLQPTSGNVGIGTAAAGAKLDVNGNVKITDGTQGLGKILTSDANGLASWQTTNATKPLIFGTLSTTFFDLQLSNYNKYSNTGAQIVIPAGSKYLVNVSCVLVTGNAPGPGQSAFVHGTFSDSPANPGITAASTASPDLIGTSVLISGGLASGASAGMMNGSVIIQNSTSASKTYYFYVGQVGTIGGYSGTINDLMVGQPVYGENQISAIPVN